MKKQYWIIILVVVVLVGLLIIRYRKNQTQNLTPEQYKSKKETDIETEKQFQAVKNYDDDYYAKLADDLETAMKGAGTNEATIYAVFDKMKSNADVEALIAAFDKRKYNKQRGELNLYSWLSADLKRKERVKINESLRNKNINFSFYDNEE